jgi:hypothetical protein
MKVQFGLLCAVAVTGGVNGDTLWDQSNYDLAVSAYVDQAFGDFPAYSTYMVNDIVVGAGGWNVTSVTSYFTVGFGFWPGSGSGTLNIFAKTGSMPGAGDDPAAGALVAWTSTDLGDGTQAVTASGLNVDLAPGEYWIGLTPTNDFGLFGQEFHRGAPRVGEETYVRNPGGGFGIGTDWGTVALFGNASWLGNFDGAFKVEGTVVPAPGVAALLVGGLLARRRRRA